jgi:hypothetical protein
MADASGIIDQAPLQDRDLLLRLSLYFDGFESRLKQGQGWFIFNADEGRGRRISTFIQRRLEDHQPGIQSFMMAWRDFALSAYVTEVGLPQLEPHAFDSSANSRANKEYAFAKRVSDDLWDQVQGSDLLVLAGIKPRGLHEALFLDRAVESRYQRRRATILLTPEMPDELAAEFTSVDSTQGCWERLFTRMYETSLVAL